MLENFLVLNIVSFNDITLEKSNKNTMSPALGTNRGQSKSTTVIMHFCIECNGKLLNLTQSQKFK